MTWFLFSTLLLGLWKIPRGAFLWQALSYHSQTWPPVAIYTCLSMLIRRTKIFKPKEIFFSFFFSRLRKILTYYKANMFYETSGLEPIFEKSDAQWGTILFIKYEIKSYLCLPGGHFLMNAIKGLDLSCT